jgi:hypothetical protein
MMAKGRNQKGEKNGNTHLTEVQVRAIRLDTRKQKEIAKDYAIARNTLWAIKTGKTWKHVTL